MRDESDRVYGIPLVQAAVIVALALTVLKGTMRLVALGIAALAVVAAPQVADAAGGLGLLLGDVTRLRGRGQNQDPAH